MVGYRKLPSQAHGQLTYESSLGQAERLFLKETKLSYNRADWIGNWVSWRVSTSTSARQPVPRLPHCRRVDFYSRLRRGRWRRGTGLLHPRATGDAGRSHGGAALGVMAPSTPERALNLA